MSYQFGVGAARLRKRESAPVAGREIHFAAPRAGAIEVEIADAARYAGLAAAWEDLVERAAEVNPFMDPAVIAAAARGESAEQAPVLLAWQGGRLAGVWAFRSARPRSRMPLAVLVTPTNGSIPDSTPVIVRDQPEPVLGAMIEALHGAPRLSKLIGIELMNDRGPVMAALVRVLARRKCPWAMLERSERPKLVSDLDPEAYFATAISHARLSKLGQLRRRLARRGNLALGIHRDADAVAAGIERFMRLEAAGWKGRFGRPLLNIPEFRDFSRAAIPALAERRRAEIWELTLDGDPVSMAVVLRCGAGAFDWRIAYDERHRDCSPGVLLAQDYTSAFLSDRAIAFADSCAQNDAGLLGTLWNGHQAMANLILDVRPGGSLAFAAWVAAERAYRFGRRVVKGPFHALKARLRKLVQREPSQKHQSKP